MNRLSTKSERNTSTKTLSLAFVCLALFLISTNMRAPIVMIGSIAPMLKTDLQIGATQIGWLGAIPVFMFAISALYSAKISRRFGIHNVLPFMIALLFIGMVLRVLVVNWSLFFLGTVLLSVAIGFLNTLAMPAIKQLAPNNISLVTGLYSLNMSIFAGIVAGIIVPMSEQVGWRFATASFSIISVFAFVIWMSLRPQLIASRKQAEDNSLAEKGVSKDQANTDQANPTTKTNLNVWKTPAAWYLAVFFGLQSLFFYLVASFLPSIWIEKGLSITQAGKLAMLFQFMAPIAIFLLIAVMNRSEKKHHQQANNKQDNTAVITNYPRVVAIFASSIITLGVAGMAFASFESYSSSALLFWSGLYTVCMGFGAALIFTLCLMLISLRTHTVDQAGELSGMAQAVAYLIAIFGPLLAGWLHELSGGWDLPLTLLTALMACNVMFAWIATRPMMIDGKELG